MDRNNNMTSRQRQAAEMRNHIFESTISLIQNHPYKEISVTDICKAAGISTGNFYHYFKNKDDILNQCFRRMNERFEQHMVDISLPPVDRIFLAFSILTDAFEKYGYHFSTAFLQNEIMNLVPYQDNPERIVYSFAFSAIKDAFAAGDLVNGDPERLYHDIYRIHKGLSFDWVIRRAGFSLREETRRMIEQIIAPYQSI